MRTFTSVLALALLAATPVPALMQAQHIPGIQIVVVDHGKITRDEAYGVRNVTTRRPVDTSTRFEIGSITKQFTAAAILQLKEHGKLSLDDPLGKYVPQYRIGRKVTLRQMLLQISGIPGYTETKAFGRLVAMRGGAIALAHPGSFDAILAMIENLPLNFRPGTKFQYSNSNYVLLGHVVELVSGMTWQQYIAAHIFKPAGMTHSSFMENEPGIADMASGYTSSQACGHWASHCHGYFIPTGTFMGWALGAGAIVSTATDLARWDLALLGGKIVSRSDVKLMMKPGALPAFGPDSHYAFGWVVDKLPAGLPRIWHNGGTFGFSSTNDLYPSLGQALIVLINTTAASADAVATVEFDRLHPALARSENAEVAGEDPAVTTRAKSVFAQFVSGTLDRSQLTAQMNQAMTAAVLDSAKEQFTELGAPQTWIYRGKKVTGNLTTYSYRVSFASGVTLNVYMALDPAGKVAGYIVSPN